jgi:hypothetical protein
MKGPRPIRTSVCRASRERSAGCNGRGRSAVCNGRGRSAGCKGRGTSISISLAEDEDGVGPEAAVAPPKAEAAGAEAAEATTAAAATGAAGADADLHGTAQPSALAPATARAGGSVALRLVPAPDTAPLVAAPWRPPAAMKLGMARSRRTAGFVLAAGALVVAGAPVGRRGRRGEHVHAGRWRVAAGALVVAGAPVAVGAGAPVDDEGAAVVAPFAAGAAATAATAATAAAAAAATAGGAAAAAAGGAATAVPSRASRSMAHWCLHKRCVPSPNGSRALRVPT